MKRRGEDLRQSKTDQSTTEITIRTRGMGRKAPRASRDTGRGRTTGQIPEGQGEESKVKTALFKQPARVDSESGLRRVRVLKRDCPDSCLFFVRRRRRRAGASKQVQFWPKCLSFLIFFLIGLSLVTKVQRVIYVSVLSCFARTAPAGRSSSSILGGWPTVLLLGLW